VKHWRKQPVTVNPAPPKDQSSVANAQNNGWPELPMPKDSHLLAPWAQALLRAARMGQVLRPPAAPVEEDKEPGEDEDAEGDVEPGFTATKWGVVPTHLEGREVKFLADRRKGLPPLNGGAAGAVAGAGQMRNIKIRKTDVEGHAHVLGVLVPEGQAVEGEIVDENTTLSEAPAPGTLVEGVGVVNAEGLVIAGDQMQPTPPRKRPPPPKRRPKGPGRGRKKKVAFAPGAGDALSLHSLRTATDGAAEHHGELTSEGAGDRATADGDVEIGEDSTLQDGEEGSEEEDDGEEGEEGEEGDREEGELSPSPMSVSKSPSREPVKSPLVSDQEVRPPDRESSEQANGKEPSSSPDLPLAAGQSFHSSQSHLETMQITAETSQDHIQPPTIYIEAPSVDIDPAPGVSTSASMQVVEIPVTSPISVNEAPQSTHASPEVKLPPEHDPFDGFTEPQAPITEPGPTNHTVHFSDGEEDLLGSLERHLDKQG
jgi:hypothetical protein